MPGAVEWSQDHLHFFPIFLTQFLACTTQTLQSVGVFLGLHRRCGAVLKAAAVLAESCPTRQRGMRLS